MASENKYCENAETANMSMASRKSSEGNAETDYVNISRKSI
jgi:hypothetical protein